MVKFNYVKHNKPMSLNSLDHIQKQHVFLTESCEGSNTETSSFVLVQRREFKSDGLGCVHICVLSIRMRVSQKCIANNKEHQKKNNI